MDEQRFAGLSFEQVVRQYAQTVTGVCIMQLQNWADAEDCFQTTFLRLYTKAPDFTDEQHLKAWLIRVATNICKNYIRDNRRTVLMRHVPEHIDARTDDAHDISWALLLLEPKYREVLYLYYCEQYRVNDIAAILNKKPNTVKSLLKRGRARLKSIYGGEAT